MSDLSRIQREVDEQKRINRDLHDQIRQIEIGIQSAYSKWNQLCNNISSTLNTGAQRVNESQKYIDASYEMQDEIDQMYVLFKNIEEANKKIRECNNKKIYDFANYNAVRKVVSAILDNIDISLVSDATITRTIEKKHLQTPDYWLTCALLAVMAWRNNNQALAKRAIDKACELDKKEATVFFMAFNLRMDRMAAAAKWFEYYLTCDLSGEDDRTFLLLFSIVNKVVYENCSDELIAKINNFIEKVISDDMQRSGYSEEQMIAKISFYLRRFIPNDAVGHTVLMKYCTERDYLAYELMLAKSNIHILDFILKTLNITDKEKKDYISEFIEEKVKKPNKAEISVEDEIKYNELIIKHQGEIENAKAEFEEIKSHRESELSLISEMIDWVYKGEQEAEVNPMVKCNMMSIINDLNRKSIVQHVNGYRNNFKSTLQIKMDDYETNANLRDENGECAKLGQFMQTKKASLLSTVKTWISIIGFVIAIAAIAGAIATEMYALFAFAGIGIIFGVVYILMCSAKKKRIISSCDIEYQTKEKILKSIIADFNSYVAEFNEYDSYATKIFDELDKI